MRQMWCRKAGLAILLLLLLLPLAGCAPLFLAAGAGTGYVVTQKDGMAKVDRFFSDLEQSIRKSTRRLYSQARTLKMFPAERGKGLVLKIHKESVAPATAGKGDRVTVTIQYAVMGAAGSGVEVRERRALLFAGKELTVLSEDTTSRSNGTWENTLTFAVPASAEDGTYTVVQEVSAQGQKRTARSSFAVR
jgi:hypothetical protein